MDLVTKKVGFMHNKLLEGIELMSKVQGAQKMQMLIIKKLEELKVNVDVRLEVLCLHPYEAISGHKFDENGNKINEGE